MCEKQLSSSEVNSLVILSIFSVKESLFLLIWLWNGCKQIFFKHASLVTVLCLSKSTLTNVFCYFEAHWLRLPVNTRKSQNLCCVKLHYFRIINLSGTHALVNNLPNSVNVSLLNLMMPVWGLPSKIGICLSIGQRLNLNLQDVHNTSKTCL